MFKLKGFKVLSLLLVMALIFVGCSAPAAPVETTYITIGTAGVGGMNYPEKMPWICAITGGTYTDADMNAVSAVMKQMSKDLVAEEKDMLPQYHPGSKKYFLEMGWIKQ